MDGEVAVDVVSRNVQSPSSKVSGTSLAGQKFGAAKGPTGLSLPAGLLGSDSGLRRRLEGLSAAGSVAVKIAVIDRSINTYGADSDVEPESDMVRHHHLTSTLTLTPNASPNPDPDSNPDPIPDHNPGP